MMGTPAFHSVIGLSLGTVLSILWLEPLMAQTVSHIALVDQIFSGNKATRVEAQSEFKQNFLHDKEAISELIDKASANLANREGIYDTLSILVDLPSDFLPDNDLRKRLVGFINASTGVSPDSSKLAAALRRRFVPESDATANEGVTWIDQADIPTYTIRIHEITAFRIVSRDNPFARQNDTDFISLAAHSSAGDYGPVSIPAPITLGHDNLGNPATVDLKIEHMPIPNNPDSTVKVAWTIVNKGHGAVEDDIHFVSDATAKTLESLGTASDNPVLFGVGELIGFSGSEWLTDCDWQIARAGIVLTGKNLYKQNFHQVFDYPASTMEDGQHKLPCSGDAHYNMELFIEKDSTN